MNLDSGAFSMKSEVRERVIRPADLMQHPAPAGIKISSPVQTLSSNLYWALEQSLWPLKCFWDAWTPSYALNRIQVFVFPKGEKDRIYQKEHNRNIWATFCCWLLRDTETSWSDRPGFLAPMCSNPAVQYPSILITTHHITICLYGFFLM